MAGARTKRRPTLASFRALLKQWHPTKNADLEPTELASGSQRRVWWKCPAGPDHEWEATVANRAGHKSGCPFCAGRRLAQSNSLLAVHPKVAKLWHPTKNGDLKPDQILAGSTKKIWWKCPNGPDHEWQLSVYVQANGRSGCPFCSGKRASVTNSLAALHPDLVEEWHPTKNGRRTPDQTTVGSGIKAWWRCSRSPHHVWQATVASRTSLSTGCPFCSGRRLTSKNALSNTSPEVAKLWHPTKNGTLTPRYVCRGSTRIVWWKCPNGPDHEWESPVADRTAAGGMGCPFCHGLRVSVTNSLARLHPRLAQQWHPTRNGDLQPHDVTYGSNRRVWWRCASGHEWVATPADRTHKGTGCPTCYQQSRTGSGGRRRAGSRSVE